ncbi:MAG: hypothetical protein K2O91_15395 [Lachnospiraceae bacterium]|nr:hypothetical protein [Lachnospiraceae bacterium]
MKTISISTGKEGIKNLIVDWIELLAQEKYSEALELILYDNTQTVDGELWVWTPERLEAAVYTYGLPWFTKEDIKREYGADCPVDYKVTSILNAPDKDRLLEDIESSIDFFDYDISADMAKTWGITRLDYKNIIGDVLFDGVPLNGERSDLTALFWIIKVNENDASLVFRELHVM